MEEGIPARLSASEGRNFGLVVGGAFLFSGMYSWWRGHPLMAAMFGSLGGFLVAAGLITPSRLGPVRQAWMKFGHAISKVTTPVLMGTIYFGIITPAGLLMRLIGKNPLERNESDGGFWVQRSTREGRSQGMEKRY